MKRNIALGIAFCSSLFRMGTRGKNAAQTSATPEALSQKVEKFGTAIPQEKVFLHIDNTCYFVATRYGIKPTSRAQTGRP